MLKLVEDDLRPHRSHVLAKQLRAVGIDSVIIKDQTRISQHVPLYDGEVAQQSEAVENVFKRCCGMSIINRAVK